MEEEEQDLSQQSRWRSSDIHNSSSVRFRLEFLRYLRKEVDSGLLDPLPVWKIGEHWLLSRPVFSWNSKRTGGGFHSPDTLMWFCSSVLRTEELLSDGTTSFDWCCSMAHRNNKFCFLISLSLNSHSFKHRSLSQDVTAAYQAARGKPPRVTAPQNNG